MIQDPYATLRESAQAVSKPNPLSGGVLNQLSGIEDLLQHAHDSVSSLHARLEPLLPMEPPPPGTAGNGLATAPSCPLAARVDHHISLVRELVCRIETLTESIRL